MFQAGGIPGRMRYGAPLGYPGPTPDYDTEKQMLKNQADALKSEMDAIKKRLGELESGAPTE
jgi:hypothetical protein